MKFKELVTLALLRRGLKLLMVDMRSKTSNSRYTYFFGDIGKNTTADHVYGKILFSTVKANHTS